MTILLRRNDQKDANFSVHIRYINKGEIVALLSVARYELLVPDVYVTRSKSKGGRAFPADLNCFDYVRIVK